MTWAALEPWLQILGVFGGLILVVFGAGRVWGYDRRTIKEHGLRILELEQKMEERVTLREIDQRFSALERSQERTTKSVHRVANLVQGMMVQAAERSPSNRWLLDVLRQTPQEDDDDAT